MAYHIKEELNKLEAVKNMEWEITNTTSRLSLLLKRKSDSDPSCALDILKKTNTLFSCLDGANEEKTFSNYEDAVNYTENWINNLNIA